MSISKSPKTATVNPRLISYKRLRQLIGCLGIGLPIVMIFYTFTFGACPHPESSISAYYHTHARNVFVGILCAVGIFLITYRGYELRDTIASTMAGIFAFIVAMFPTDAKAMCEHNGLINCTIGTIHITAATLLFLTFAYMSVVLFTQSSGYKTARKIKRNRVYYTCGYVILACILSIAVYKLTKSSWQTFIPPVFGCEAIALLAFGTSWLVKGEGIPPLNDKKTPIE